MSKKLFIGLLTQDQLTALHNAGHTIVADAKAASLAVEGVIVASPVGAAVAKIVDDIKDQQKTGAEKFSAVVADAIPLVASFVADGGISLVASVEDTAKAVVQTIYNATVGKVIAGL